jgi:hypothetical protein
MSEKPLSIPPVYSPNDDIPYSAIYRVYHDRYHALVVDAIGITGGKFPSCKECGEKVRFVPQSPEYLLLSELSQF